VEIKLKNIKKKTKNVFINVIKKDAINKGKSRKKLKKKEQTSL